MLRKMIVEVRRVWDETYVISAEDGYDMPNGTADTIQFVEDMKQKILSGEVGVDHRRMSCTIKSVEYIDEN